MIFDNNVKSVWNQNERKQLILTDDHNTFSTTNWVDLTLNRWGQKRTHAKIHPVYMCVCIIYINIFENIYIFRFRVAHLCGKIATWI